MDSRYANMKILSSSVTIPSVIASEANYYYLAYKRALRAVTHKWVSTHCLGATAVRFAVGRRVLWYT